MAGPGLVGKVPSQADFVRVNAGDPVAQALHRWLEEAHEGVKYAGARLEDQPTYFLFAAPGAKSALIGALRPSTDKVGRVFPLAVWVDVDAALAARQLPVLPEAYAPFLEAADALVAAAAKGQEPVAELSARLARLPLPSPADFTRGEERRRNVLSSQRVSEVQRLFEADGGGIPGGHYYALRTLLSACAPERGREPAKAQVTLDCPAPAALGPLFWLELTQGLLRWSAAPPSLLWTTGDSARLLLSVGPQVPSALLYLARPDSTASRLWPLRTRKPSAVESAAKSFTASQKLALDQPTASLAQLCASLAV